MPFFYLPMDCKTVVFFCERERRSKYSHRRSWESVKTARENVERRWKNTKTTVLQVYCVSLVNGDKTVLEYSGPRSLKAKVTSRRAKGWKHSLVSPRHMFPQLCRARTTICGLDFAVLSDLNWIYHRQIGGFTEIFFIVSVNQCMWLQRLLRIVHSFTFRSLKDSWPFFGFTRDVSEKRKHLPC